VGELPGPSVTEEPGSQQGGDAAPTGGLRSSAIPVAPGAPRSSEGWAEARASLGGQKKVLSQVLVKLGLAGAQPKKDH
jgi:hypothetical protein